MKILILALLCFYSGQVFAQPANDEPCGAIDLSVTQGGAVCTPSTLLSWTGATASATTPFPSCGQWSTGKRDVWYKFSLPANVNKLNIRTAAGTGTTDAIMAVYTAASCSGPFTQVGCSDDFVAALPGFDSLAVTGGQTFYLRISQYNATNPNGELSICVTSFYIPAAADPLKTVGINVEFPQANLDVNGTTILRNGVQLLGGNPGAGKVLTSDAGGNATWQPIPSAPVVAPVAFAATLDSSRTLFYNVDTKLHFGASANGPVSFNPGTVYSNATDEFTAPSAGIYEFTVRMTCVLVSGTPYGVEAHFAVNGTAGYSSLFALPPFSPGSIGVHSAVHTALYNLAAGDKVTVFAKLSSQSVSSAQITNFAGSSNNSMFWGRKVN
ncbi:hypothetical protein [Ferruginibacter sp. HRS2-29]|uniref:hypothetical protein n=1 Tax=Ferruginibacter sp. HRS2-29 TaxID=2487334 RepID=UPI0020CC9439|nr:hypothetical protein [Ferruginibacter sp. HRS2-29]MCP9752424.1 hypothetical protein [Ferruginibacter sp. HRS2-29]